MHGWDAAKAAVLRGFTHLHILVVGDLMLDRYIWGSVTRISPEAPVPVVKYQRESEMLGGAANVAHNLLNLGVKTSLAGFVGEDARGETLRSVARARGLDASGFLTATGLRTTTKTRILGEQHQLLRIDDETTDPPSDVDQKRLLDWVQKRLQEGKCDAIILSDYAKGLATPAFCQALVALARREGVPLHIDPKGRDFDKYRGATSIKPNRGEMALYSGASPEVGEELIDQAKLLQSNMNLQFVALTLGGEGAVVIDATRVEKIPTEAKEVFDVSGAGDTTLATMVTALAAGLDPFESVRLASLAAAQVVAHVGSTPVSMHELLLALYERARGEGARKLIGVGEAEPIAAAWRATGEQVVVVELGPEALSASLVVSLKRKGEAGTRLVVKLAEPDSDLATSLASLDFVDAVVVP